MLPAELVKRRNSMLLSQAELAARLGVTVTTVSRWETGKAPIPLMVRKLVQYMEDESLTEEEIERRNRKMQQQMHRRARERETTMTDDERAAGERWFGNERKERTMTVAILVNSGADDVLVVRRATESEAQQYIDGQENSLDDSAAFFTVPTAELDDYLENHAVIERIDHRWKDCIVAGQ